MDEVEFGPHWTLKLKTCTDRITEKDGRLITRESLMGIPERIIQVGQLTAEEAEKLRTFYNIQWTTFFTAEKDDGSSQAIDMLLESVKKLGKDHFVEQAVMTLVFYFSAIDKDKDGYIDQDDFTRFFYILGIPEDLSVPAFQALDVDKDGRMSRDEFLKAGKNFFVQEKECYPSDLFLGPI